MSSAPVSAATESELVDKLLQIVDRINAKTTELQNAVNDKLGWLPGRVIELSGKTP